MATPPVTRMPFASSTPEKRAAAQRAGSPTASRASQLAAQGHAGPSSRDLVRARRAIEGDLVVPSRGRRPGRGGRAAVVTEEETARQPASGTASSRAGSPTRSPGCSDTSTRLSLHDRADTSVP